MISFAGLSQELPGTKNLVVPHFWGAIWGFTPYAFQCPRRWVVV